MTSSSSLEIHKYKVFLFQFYLILFLVLFPALIGHLNSGFYNTASSGKNFEISFYSLCQIYPDIDSRYDQPYRPKWLKNQRVFINLLNLIHARFHNPGLNQNTLYYQVNPEYVSQHVIKAKVLLLDMPPPFDLV